MNIKKHSQNKLILYIFMISLILVGSFYVFASAIVTILLLINIYIQLKCKKKLEIPIGIELTSLIVLSLFYGISCFWAIDYGVALLGFVKYLPLPFFYISLCIDKEAKDDIKKLIPLFGGIMVVISFIFKYIPFLNNYFSVSNRIAGFFQYPNTFALFLAIGIITLLLKENLKIFDYILTAVLGIGVLLSGSRAVAILLIITLIILIFIIKGKNRIFALITLVSVILFAFVYVILTNNFNNIGRLFTSSFIESTFLGRILYDKDALPEMFSHIFGQGYDSYEFVQGSFQTGVYNVKFIHNDFFQFVFEIGFIPVILFIVALVKSFFVKKNSKWNRVVMLLICAHALLDYDLQYISIFFILLMTLDTSSKKVCIVRKKSLAFFSITVFSSLICLYFAIVSFSSTFLSLDITLSIYPIDTHCQIEKLTSCDDINELNNIANEILLRNKCVSIAYSAKALNSYHDYNIDYYIKYKKKAIYYSPYSIDEYNDYCEKLISVIKTSNKNSDEFLISKNALLEVPSMLDALKKRTSGLAYYLDEKPTFEINQEYSKFISKLT